MQPPEASSGEDGRHWAELLTVNSIAPYLLAKALLPAVAQTQGKLIAISSRMGSIADSSGGYVPYRSSKAALNMAWNALAMEARPKGAAAAVLNPGWVRTDMGGPNASIDPPESIRGMRRVIDGLDLARTGSFLDRDGSEIPW
jgi:NAD(P)-dependent dehydrogenase (short-subunit alcohol dehydrogenase family)